MPEPKENETKKDFIARCIPIVLDDETAEDHVQAVAVCNSMWEKAQEKAVSLDAVQREIQAAWDEQHPRRDRIIDEISSSWIVETFDDHVIVWVNGGEHWSVPYTRDGDDIIFADRSEWKEVEEKREWTAKTGNMLKAVSKTDNELRVANYIVLFGGRDLTGAPSNGTGFYTGEKNQDGSQGEFFTKATQFDSPYTATGHLLIDMEHGVAKGLYGKSAPGRDDIFGVVDWKTLQIDDTGAWVERALNRRAKYMEWVETLIDAGVVGSSSEAIQGQVEKKASGEITTWPIKRDTFTFTATEPRMMSENVIRAAKALGIQINRADKPEPKAQPGADVDALAVEAAKARAAQKQLELEISLLEAT